MLSVLQSYVTQDVWPAHKAHCSLVGTMVDGSSCGVEFVGQSAAHLKELVQHPVYGKAALE